MTNEQTIYAFAHVETWLEDYAKSNNLPTHELTERVADLLLSQTRRSVLGTENSVPSLRRNGATRGKTPRKMAVAHGPYRKTQVNKSHSKGIKAYWAAMTPEQRSAEIQRRFHRRGRAKRS